MFETAFWYRVTTSLDVRFARPAPATGPGVAVAAGVATLVAGSTNIETKASSFTRYGTIGRKARILICARRILPAIP
jgi:hypothetical protein